MIIAYLKVLEGLKKTVLNDSENNRSCVWFGIG